MVKYGGWDKERGVEVGVGGLGAFLRVRVAYIQNPCLLQSKEPFVK